MTGTASGKLDVAQTAVPAWIDRGCEISGICKRKRCEKGQGLWRHDMLAQTALFRTTSGNTAEGNCLFRNTSLRDKFEPGPNLTSLLVQVPSRCHDPTPVNLAVKPMNI